MVVSQIRYQLTLAFRLLDTASRDLVGGPDIRFFRNGEPVKATPRTGGYFALINYPREDFLLGIRARDFEPLDLPIHFSDLDPNFPELTIHMVPGPSYRSPFHCISITGTLPGIQSIMAVKPDDSTCFIREFDARKKLLTIFNPHRLEFDRVFYALANPSAGIFEPFRICEQQSTQVYKIDHPLSMEFQSGFPICSIIFGMVYDQEKYCLRLRDEGGQPALFLRWEIDNQPFFKTIDIRQPDTFSLL